MRQSIKDILVAIDSVSARIKKQTSIAKDENQHFMDRYAATRRVVALKEDAAALSVCLKIELLAQQEEEAYIKKVA